MIFINTIAEIIHKITDQNGGIPNKNLGDSFLLVWKFDDLNNKKKQKKIMNKKE